MNSVACLRVKDFSARKTGGHGHLLVELRRLREIGVSVEIVETEDVGARFAGGSDDLRAVEFKKIVIEQPVAQGGGHLGLDLEDEGVFLGAQVDPAEVEAGVDRRVGLDRERVGAGLDLYRLRDDLDAAELDVVVGDGGSLDGYYRVERDAVDRVAELGMLLLDDGDLDLSGDVADDDEGHRPLVAYVFDEARNPDVCSRDYFADVNSFH